MARTACAVVAAAAVVAACGAPTLLPELAEAERLEREGHLEEALDAYERAALTCHTISDRERRRARCAEAHLYRAELLERLDRPREAVSAYLEVPGAVDDPEAAARALYQAGRTLLELGDDERAYDLLWQTITDYPNQLAASDAVKLVTDDGRERAPRQLYHVLRDLWGPLAETDIAPNLILAMAEIAEEDLGDLRAALALYDELAARHEDRGLHDDALWRGARLARQLGEPRGALSRYRQLIQTREELPFGFGAARSSHVDDALLEVGRILRDDLGDYEAAVTAFRKLPDQFPNSRLHDDALFEEAVTHAEAGNRTLACAALTRLEARWPDSRYELERGPALRRELDCGS